MKFLREYTISAHAPAGGATSDHHSPPCKTAYFYSRPCGRGDHRRYAAAKIAGLFLLTPLREGRPHFKERRRGLLHISTHAPAGGATEGLAAVIGTIQFLLTPLREGRPEPYDNVLFPDLISTHAPAGGATQLRLGQTHFQPISTHAPAGGATIWGRSCWQSLRHFYSRPCGRGDTTSGRSRRTTSPFLLTPLREGRLNRIRNHPPPSSFLLTPLREGRPSGRQIRTGGANFYSRPCGRGDQRRRCW